MRLLTTFLIFLVLLLLTLVGCNKTIEVDPMNDGKGEYYDSGMGEIGPDGGRITVGDTSSPLYFTRIEIYPHALDETVYFNIVPVEPAYYLLGSDDHLMIEIQPPGIQFNFDAYITLPWDPGTHFFYEVPYCYVPEMQMIYELPIRMQYQENFVDANTATTGIFFVDERKLSISTIICTIDLEGNTRLAGYIHIPSDFNTIPTSLSYAEEGLPDAQSILNSTYMPGVASHFKVFLRRKDYPDTLSYKEYVVYTIACNEKNDSSCVRIEEIINNQGYSVFMMENIPLESVANEWMSGFPLLYIFQDYIPVKGPNHIYYLEVIWSFEKEGSFFTEQYSVEQWQKQSMYNMTETTEDMNHNGILDIYEGARLLR